MNEHEIAFKDTREILSENYKILHDINKVLDELEGKEKNSNNLNNYENFITIIEQ